MATPKNKALDLESNDIDALERKGIIRKGDFGTTTRRKRTAKAKSVEENETIELEPEPLLHQVDNEMLGTDDVELGTSNAMLGTNDTTSDHASHVRIGTNGYKYVRSKRKGGPRTRKQLMADRTEIARLFRLGFTQREISEKVRLPLVTVNHDIKAIIAEWREARIGSIDELRAQELEKIANLENEAWQAWSRSQKDFISVTKDVMTGKLDSHVKTSRRKEGRNGDARYLATIQWCIETRSRLLGLLDRERPTAQKVVVEFTGGGAIGLPDPRKALPMGELVEGTFEEVTDERQLQMQQRRDQMAERRELEKQARGKAYTVVQHIQDLPSDDEKA